VSNGMNTFQSPRNLDLYSAIHFSVLDRTTDVETGEIHLGELSISITVSGTNVGVILSGIYDHRLMPAIHRE